MYQLAMLEQRLRSTPDAASLYDFESRLLLCQNRLKPKPKLWWGGGLADLLMNSVMWLMRWHFAVAPLWQHFPPSRGHSATVVYRCTSLAEWSHHTAVASRTAARRASSWPLIHSLYTSQITFILGSSGRHEGGGRGGWWLTLVALALLQAHICEGNTTWHACFSVCFPVWDIAWRLHLFCSGFKDAFSAGLCFSCWQQTPLKPQDLHAFLTPLAYMWTQGSLVLSKHINRKQNSPVF